MSKFIVDGMEDGKWHKDYMNEDGLIDYMYDHYLDGKSELLDVTYVYLNHEKKYFEIETEIEKISEEDEGNALIELYANGQNDLKVLILHIVYRLGHLPFPFRKKDDLNDLFKSIELPLNSKIDKKLSTKYEHLLRYFRNY